MNTTSTQGLSLNAETYERMFSARVSTPDPQLAEYLNTYPHKDKAWYPTYKELATLLFHDDAESIYKDIGPDLPDIPYDSIGSKPSTAAAVRMALGRPIQFMIEAGSFTGKSAVNFGRVVAEDGGLLMCIDPWTGDINMILQNFSHMSPRKNGYPAIYTRFLQQVVRSGLEKTILPLPMTAISGARLAKTLNLKVDVVYLDSAHEFGETFFELHLFWDLLLSGGILVGDDIDYFPSVRHDVYFFAAQKGVHVETFDNTFLIRKP